MKRLKTEEAATKLAELIKDSQVLKEPIYIEGTSQDNDDEDFEENAVLLSEKNWHSILETLYLHSFSLDNTLIPDERKEIETAKTSTDNFYW